MGQILKYEFFCNFFPILLPKRFEIVSFDEATNMGSRNIGAQSFQKFCFNLTEFCIRAKAGNFEGPYLLDATRYHLEIFWMFLSF